MKNAIVMYSMKNCQLCNKARRLLDYWGYEYVVLDIEPYIDCDYPFFYIGAHMYTYENMVDMIAKDTLRLAIEKENER